jgi:hypothetical protein
MSYLDSPRITFGGRFLCDVPTMNNRAADFNPGATPDQGWNPVGTGAFDFLGCTVNGGESSPGEPVAVGDPAFGLGVVSAADRSSAKLVDLDPAWQVSSEIWGLTVRIIGSGGETLLTGRFRTAPFRDIWPRLPSGTGLGKQGASFTSVLEDVGFSPGCGGYPVLAALSATAPARLSVGLTVVGVLAQAGRSTFATGRLTGCIGPWRDGEPLGLVAGRRLEMGQLAPGVLVGPSVAALSPDGTRLTLDLGNAYPVADPGATAHPQAVSIGVGVLPGEQVRTGDILSADASFSQIGMVSLIPSPPPSGIVSFTLEPGVTAALATRPLALFTTQADGRRLVVSRETADGLYVRADDFVHRIEAGEPATATLYARRRGEPADGVTIHLARHRLGAPGSPVITTPDHVETGPDGTAPVTLTTADPRSPRGALDGVIEYVAYSPRLKADGSLDLDGSGLNQFDVIVAHVRDGYQPPSDAGLEAAVQRLLEPYARHYPIMTGQLADLGDLDALRPWRAALLLALSRDIEDPNYMPVTRDLSAPKRATILRWLNGLAAEPGGMSRRHAVFRPGVHDMIAVQPRPDSPAEPDAKTEAGREVAESTVEELGRLRDTGRREGE